MKSLTKKLLASVFVMVFALVAVATTTFAWFTISNETNISTVDVSVKEDGGDLLFKVTAKDETNYKSSDYVKQLSWETIKKAIYKSGDTATKFDAVTTQDLTTFSLLKDPTLEDSNYNTAHTSTAAANANGQYIQFTLNFKSSSIGYLVLTNKTSAKGTKYKFNLSAAITYSGQLIAEDDTAAVSGAIPATGFLSVNPIDPLRISFVNSGTGASSKSVVYNPISDNAHNAAASDDPVIPTTNNLAVQYYKSVWKDNTIVAGHLDGALTNDAVGINKFKYTNTTFLASNLLNEKGVETYKTNNWVIGAFTESDKEETVTITLWMEGWDPDCFNAILNQSITATFGFAVVKTSADPIV